MSGPFGRPVYVIAAAALTPLGLGWRGLAGRLARGERPRTRAVPPLPPAAEPCEPRHQKMMSRAAYLAAAAVKLVLGDEAVTALGLSPPELGCFLGVGASGGDMNELEAMLGPSVAGAQFQLGRFGDAGLRAANPLFAFQLMNNFTLCHAAILAGLQGPNAAFFSRGAGTVTALREAAFAVGGGEVPLALAGGADSALHPVTALELGRAGVAPLSEGAAILALGAQPNAASPVRLERAEALVGAARAPAPAGPTLRVSGAEIDAILGHTLAAGPALAWIVALDVLAARPHGRVRAEAIGLDGVTTVVELAKGAA